MKIYPNEAQQTILTDLIPYNELDDGFERSRYLVNSLIESSKLVCQSHHYHISIGLSILAYEEIYKMTMFFYALQNKKGISKEDWDLITKGDRKNRKSTHMIKHERSYLDRKNSLKKEALGNI